jgi:hypothetical protein
MLAAHTLSTILTEFLAYEVLTAVINKNFILWFITPCSQLKVNRRFGGIYRLHIQSRRICPARNQRGSRWPQAGSLLGLFFKFEDGGDISPRGVGRLSMGYIELLTEFISDLFLFIHSHLSNTEHRCRVG